MGKNPKAKELAIKMREEFHSKPCGEVYKTSWDAPKIENMRLLGVLDNCVYISDKWNKCPYDDVSLCREKNMDYDIDNTNIHYTHTFGKGEDSSRWNKREYYEPLLFCHKNCDPNKPKKIWILGNILTHSVGIDYTSHDEFDDNVNLDNWKKKVSQYKPEGKYLTDLGKLKQLTYRPIENGEVSDERIDIDFDISDTPHITGNAIEKEGDVIATKLFIMDKQGSNIVSNPYKAIRGNPKPVEFDIDSISHRMLNKNSRSDCRLIYGKYKTIKKPPQIPFQNNLSKMLMTDFDKIKKNHIDKFDTNFISITEEESLAKFKRKLMTMKVNWSKEVRLNRILTFYRMNFSIVDNYLSKIEMHKTKYEAVREHLELFEMVVRHLRSFYMIQQLRLFYEHRRDYFNKTKSSLKMPFTIEKDKMYLGLYPKKKPNRLLELTDLIIIKDNYVKKGEKGKSLPIYVKFSTVPNIYSVKKERIRFYGDIVVG